MGFHHTLFVRQSIDNVDELKKYMYLTIDAGDQRQPTEQGTYGSAFLNASRSYAPTAQGADAGTPLERCAFICDEVARPPPSQEQGDVNVSQCLLTSTQDPIISERRVGKGLPCSDTTYERVAFKTKVHLSAERSSNGAGVDAERLIYAEHLRSAPPLLRSRGVAGGTAVPLFWAIYIAIHGYEEYAQIGRGYSNFEINEKQKIVATIQKSPTILKQTNHIVLVSATTCFAPTVPSIFNLFRTVTNSTASEWTYTDARLVSRTAWF